MRRRTTRRPRSRIRKLLDYGLAFALLGLTALVAARMDRVETRKPAGNAIVNDGDSLTLGQERIRLRGIDAPELAQLCTRDEARYSCGRQAREELARLISGRQVTCSGWERDRYDRLLAVCSAGGVELNRALVEAGWAVAYGGYTDAEAQAREARRGLWQGSFDRPRDWRAEHNERAEEEHTAIRSGAHFLRAVAGWPW